MNPATTTVNAKRDDGKAVSGAANLPLAPRARAWDDSAAERRVRSWAEAADGPNAKYRSAFFWYDSENADNFAAYKLQFADVIDGELHAVPRAIFAVAGALQGARGGVDIPDSDKAAIRRKVSRYYARMREEFEDENIVPPWEKTDYHKPENKSINLGDLMDTVARTFYAQFPDVHVGEAHVIYWVNQFWSDFIVVKQDGTEGLHLWQVGFTMDNGVIIDFAPPPQWVEVAMLPVPVQQPAPGRQAADIQPDGKQAGPVKPPTSDADMLRLIEIETEELLLLSEV